MVFHSFTRARPPHPSSCSTADGTAGLQVTYWLDFATLLSNLRNQGLLPWDQDSDLGVELAAGVSVPVFRSTLEKDTGLVSYFDDSRHLLQLYSSAESNRQVCAVCVNGGGRARALQQTTGGSHVCVCVCLWREQGPHVDIWVYSRVVTEGEEFLCNKDNSGHYHCRTPCQIFPLKNVHWTAMGVNVTVPAASRAIAHSEYGPNYGVVEVYRADCLHNVVTGRLFY